MFPSTQLFEKQVEIYYLQFESNNGVCLETLHEALKKDWFVSEKKNSETSATLFAQFLLFAIIIVVIIISFYS